MKQCPQCGQFTGEENDFCPNDGTRLGSASGEIPTVVINTPRPNPYPTGQTFVPTPAPSPAPGSTKFLYVIILVLAMVATGLGVAFFMGGGDKERASTNTETNRSIPAPTAQPAPTSTPEPPPTPAPTPKPPPPTPKVELPPGARAAYIQRGPTNVRLSPGGTIQCVLRTGTKVRIYGDTGEYDNNGLWYHTDACGGSGVIHSTQFRFTN